MKIKHHQKQYTIEMQDIEPPTLGMLKSKIKEMIKECSNLPNEKILLFHNKAKVTGDDELSLTDDKLRITNDSVIFVVTIASQPPMEEKKTGEKTNAPAPTGPQQGNPFGMGNAGMYGMGDQSGLEKQVLNQIISNPDSVLEMMEKQMPNMTDEQKAFMKQNLEIIKNNPEIVNQMFNNPAVMNAMRGPGMGGNNMFNPMMGSPMMNPMMGSPMMNPMMGSPMMNNYGYNPYNPYMAPYLQPTPPNGPCFHGFYPPKYVNGKIEPQDPKEVYADKITSLKEMGFTNKEDDVISALVEAKGEISVAIDILSKKPHH